MKTIGLFLALSLFAGCKKGGSAASDCSDAVSKGVDKMIAMRKQKLDEQGSAMPPELKARMEERSQKMAEVATALKQAITNRCTEDKWPADVIKCYGQSTAMEELRACREKLTQDQQAKVKADEMQVMMKTMGGGMGGPPGMGQMPPGHEGMGGMPPGHEGMGGMPPGHEGMGGPAGGPPPAGGSAAAPAPAPAGSAAGSAK